MDKNADYGECLICSRKLKFGKDSFHRPVKEYSCPLCGTYSLGARAEDCLTSKKHCKQYQNILFYHLRVVLKNHNNHNTEKAPIIVMDDNESQGNIINLNNLSNNINDDTFSNRLDKIIELLATEIREIGDEFSGIFLSQCVLDYKSIKNFFLVDKDIENDIKKQIENIVNTLIKLDYIIPKKENTNGFPFTFAPKGWERVDAIQRDNRKKQTVFIAMPFSPSNENIKDNVIHKERIAVIRRCVNEAIRKSGYIPITIDAKEHNNNIVEEIYYEIKNAAFVISDLSAHRGGVYYEAGYAKGLGKEVIFSCHESYFKDIHFDVKQINTISWNEADEEKFINDLVRRIEVTVGFFN